MIDTQVYAGIAERSPAVTRKKPNPPDKNVFRSERLADLLRQKGLNQYELAQHLGVHQSQVSNWLHGRSPSLETLVRLADFFEVPADYLIGRVDDNQAFYQAPELTPDEWSFLLAIRDGSFADALRKLAEEMARREENANNEGSQEG